MAEIIMDPKNFQDQIDDFQKGADSIKELKYELDKKNVRLQSIDKLMDCVDEANKLIQKFGDMLNQDAQAMRVIKAQWMNADETAARDIFG